MSGSKWIINSWLKKFGSPHNQHTPRVYVYCFPRIMKVVDFVILGSAELDDGHKRYHLLKNILPLTLVMIICTGCKGQEYF